MTSNMEEEEKNFPSNPDSLPIVYTVLEATVAIIAVIGNLLVIVVFIQDRRLRKVTNFYITSLSLADLLVGAIGIPSAIMTKIGLPRSSRQLCLTMLSLLVVLCTISILNLVAVSLDRYWAILHPLNYHKRISEKTAFVIICACWILGSVIGFLPLFGWRNEYHDSCYFIPTMDYNFLMFLYFVTIVFPAFIMALFYIRIYIVVMQQLSLNKVRHLRMSECSFSVKSKFQNRKETNIISDFIIGNSNVLEQNNAVTNNDYIYKQQCHKSSFSRQIMESNANNQRAKYFPSKTTRFYNNRSPNGKETMTDVLDLYHSNNNFDKVNRYSKWRSLLSFLKLNERSLNERNGKSANRYVEKQFLKNCSAEKLSYSRREVKKAQKLFVIVVFFMICWIPLYTSNTIQAICRECPTLSSNLLDFLIILSHINSAGSPFLYAFHMKDFRQALRRLIFKGAFNQRKLRDLRREELFSVSGQHRAHSKDMNRQESSTGKRTKSSDRYRNIINNKRHHQNLSLEYSSYHESVQQIYIGSTHSRSCHKSSIKEMNHQKYYTVPMRSKFNVINFK